MSSSIGGQTAAAVANFGAGRTPREVVKALAEVKEAAIRALQESAHPWTEDVFAAALAALSEIRSGDRDELFPLDLAQGGAGTSLHMNICEVLANLVNESVGRDDAFHFLDDCARDQSTNDVVTTAAIVVVNRLARQIEQAVIELQEALVAKENAWRGITVAARTEWQDAMPMDLSQVAAAWAGSAERDRWRLGKLKERIRTVPLGGGAIGVGTGSVGSAGAAYIFAAERFLREISGLPLQRSQNLTDAVAQRDDLAELAGGFALVAGNIHKLCGDLFFYTSTVVGELRLPHLQWGSTAMPAKNNPVLVEYADGLAIRAAAACASIERFAQEGRLQLNAFTPFMLDAFLRASADLNAALRALARDLLPRLEVNAARAAANLAASPAAINALRAELPYERLKAIASKRFSSEGMNDAGTSGEKLGELCAGLAVEVGVDEAIVRKRLGLPSDGMDTHF